MHLVLSRHGIWYYRRCYTLASGKRKEIRKSLGTRNKRQAKLLAAAIQANTYNSDIGSFAASVITQDKIPSLDTCIANYLKENSHLWQDRHKSRIKSVLSELPKLHLTKSDISTLKTKWLRKKSIATVNKCLGYCSMFYDWLQVQHEGIDNRFAKARLKGHVEKPRNAYSPTNKNRQ